jgi:hypothetical protein
MSMSQDPVVPTNDTTEAAEFVAGFRRVEAEIRALPERELEPVNIDLQAAVTTVLGALPELRTLRSEFAKLPGFDLGNFDKLRDYTLAVGHTHAMYRAAAGPVDVVTQLAEEVTALRDMLQTDAAALAKRRILDEVQVQKLRGGSGYKNVAFEVVGLVGLFRDNWSKIEARSALKLEELEHAGARAQELVTAVGLREQTPAIVGAAAMLRQQAFTLFLRAYDEARRALSYLRWHDRDGDSIAPSLFAGRRRRADSVEATEPEISTPAQTPPASTTAVGIPAATAPVTVATGLPGSAPFARS